MILTGNKIIEEVENNHIVIEPFNKDAVTTNSYDLTLSDKLVIYTDEILDPKKEPHTKIVEIPDEGYELKRGEFLLGSSNEFVGSDFYVPIVHAKSSIARLGLFIHITSGLFDIGCKCNVTFHLYATMPIKLYKKTPIEGEKTSIKVKRFFKMFGSALLLILECIWYLICSLLLVDFILDITKKGKK